MHSVYWTDRDFATYRRGVFELAVGCVFRFFTLHNFINNRYLTVFNSILEWLKRFTAEVDMHNVYL